jgi:hypothetical protein
MVVMADEVLDVMDAVYRRTPEPNARQNPRDF